MSELVVLDRVEQVLTIGLNRPKKKNALNPEMFRALSAAYAEFCDDPQLRCGVLYSTGEMFCSGLDLMEMSSTLMGQNENNESMTTPDQVDPFAGASITGRAGRERTKPMLSAISGRCYTGGIELCLATDIIVAEETVVFSQAEILRGLMPLGGAIDRYVQRIGWGNAMRWLLTGDEFNATDAYRTGLVNELVSEGQAMDRAMEIAFRISAAAPLGVQGTLANARVAISRGSNAAAEHLRPYMLEHISSSSDLQEGIKSLMERRSARFTGT